MRDLPFEHKKKLDFHTPNVGDFVMYCENLKCLWFGGTNEASSAVCSHCKGNLRIWTHTI